MAASASSKGKGKGKGVKGVREFDTQPQVHFITKSRRTASVPISEVLSRLHIEVNGAVAVLRGRRTSFHTLTSRGSAEVYLPDGTPLWQVRFRARHARRPPKAASTRLMQAQDWRGCLLVCFPSKQKHVDDETSPMVQSPGESASSTAGVVSLRPCRYGSACRDKADPEHSAKYSHPTGPSTCMTAGCTRAPSGRYATCCAECKATEGESHSSSCLEVAPVAILLVEYVAVEAQDWVVSLRSLSDKAASAAAQLCRYKCGMMTGQNGGKTFDTCCKTCATHSVSPSCIEHDAECAGPAPAKLQRDFEETVDLSSLVPQNLDWSGPTVVGSVSEERREIASKECRICFCDDAVSHWCSFSHSFCKSCMARHVEEELDAKGVLPACPLSAECGHLLTRDLVEDVIGTSYKGDVIMSRFDLLAQRLGLQGLGAFPCAQETCQDWIVPSQPGKQQLVECPRCKIRFCSLCKRKPFHWRIPRCEDVTQIDEAWHQWLREDRDTYIQKLAVTDPEYRQILEQLGSKKAEQLRMIVAAEARRKEFLEMEDWKAQNCKCCPSCKRVINKVDGCDSMVCGRNYHGGDVQNGCGASFNWSSAPGYIPQQADHIPKVDLDVAGSPVDSKHFWECSPGVFLRCAMCKYAIRGPLFLCIDCVACCACFRCANGMGSAAGGHHDPDSHVFSVLWKLGDLSRSDLESLRENHLTTRRKNPRPDEKLSAEEVLIDMGFSESQAQQALSASSGDLEAAAARLLM